MARAHTELAIQTLAGIARNGDSEQARAHCADLLLNRGWGRPVQPVTGADGESDIEITIRHILGEKKK